MSTKKDVSNNSELSPKEKLKEKLDEGIRRILESQNFKNWLDVRSKYYTNRYSFTNSFLIFSQKSEASYVLGYEAWKEYGRNVAQGATGIKILMPVLAKQKQQGEYWGKIKYELLKQLDNNPTEPYARYRVGTGDKYCEFTMQRSNGLVGFQAKGKERGIFNSEEEARKFVDRCIVGKYAVSYTMGTVFDVKDTVIPEYLWLKSGFKKEELVLGENGKPIMNHRGEYKVINTPERQGRLNVELDMEIPSKDTAKMKVLLDSCVAVSDKKGVPVTFKTPEEDEVLKDGAKGYYCRSFTDETPNGYIVIDDTLEETEQCAVLMHEMGHADLHSDIEKLKTLLGEEKISKSMKEIQAEAVAYSVASNFGITTDTSSFAYLAVYTRGFEMQDLNTSIEAIYQSSKKLTEEISAELEARGYNKDLTLKENVASDEIKKMSADFLEEASEARTVIQQQMVELPQMIGKYSNDDMQRLSANIQTRKSDVEQVLKYIDELNTAKDNQAEIITKIENTLKGIRNAETVFDIEKEKLDKADITAYQKFISAPEKVLDELSKEYPALNSLSSAQRDYICKSKYIRDVVSEDLKKDTSSFVNTVIDRANAISDVASKNGTFVEINFCERWTDKPYFTQGTICTPKFADKKVTECESQARVFSEEADVKGEYFPYTKCSMTVFCPHGEDGKLNALTTRVDIGDGSQNSLQDHLTQICGSDEEKSVLNKFNEALNDRQYKKLYTIDVEQKLEKKAMNVEEIKKEIKERAKNVEVANKSVGVEKRESEHNK